jgi:hypothetical protein
MSVEQISVATGRKLTVLYRRSLGDTGEVNGAPAPYCSAMTPVAST